VSVHRSDMRRADMEGSKLELVLYADSALCVITAMPCRAVVFGKTPLEGAPLPLYLR
jgi:hypothetical protein